MTWGQRLTATEDRIVFQAFRINVHSGEQAWFRDEWWPRWRCESLGVFYFVIAAILAPLSLIPVIPMWVAIVLWGATAIAGLAAILNAVKGERSLRAARRKK